MVASIVKPFRGIMDKIMWELLLSIKKRILLVPKPTETLMSGFH